MHYKGGQEVKLGDLANYPAMVYEPTDATAAASKHIMRQGIVVARFAKADKCNVVIATAFLETPGWGPSGEKGLPVIAVRGYTTDADVCELVARQQT